MLLLLVLPTDCESLSNHVKCKNVDVGASESYPFLLSFESIDFFIIFYFAILTCAIISFDL